MFLNNYILTCAVQRSCFATLYPDKGKSPSPYSLYHFKFFVVFSAHKMTHFSQMQHERSKMNNI